MTRKKRRETPEWKWEQALIDDYYDHCWHEVLDPLYTKFKRWEAGELDHEDISRAIHETRKETQHVYSLFCEKRGFLVRVSQWNRAWFEPWLADHPPPDGIELVVPPQAVYSPEAE